MCGGMHGVVVVARCGTNGDDSDVIGLLRVWGARIVLRWEHEEVWIYKGAETFLYKLLFESIQNILYISL